VDDWVGIHRERYHHLRLHAREAMCGRLAAGRRYGEAVEVGLAAVRAKPLRESAHEELVKVHLAEGNRFEATRQYQSCCRLLRNELGLEPSPRMQALLTSEITHPIRPGAWRANPGAPLPSGQSAHILRKALQSRPACPKTSLKSLPGNATGPSRRRSSAGCVSLPPPGRRALGLCLGGRQEAVRLGRLNVDDVPVTARADHTGYVWPPS
jgi:hypothetical protein